MITGFAKVVPWATEQSVSVDLRDNQRINNRGEGSGGVYNGGGRACNLCAADVF